MRQKGISSEAIEQALSEISDQDEENLAYQAAGRQARKYTELEWPDFRQKMAGFLARRGFNYETSLAAIQRVWHDLSAGETDQEPASLSPGNKNSDYERHHDERR